MNPPCKTFIVSAMLLCHCPADAQDDRCAEAQTKFFTVQSARTDVTTMVSARNRADQSYFTMPKPHGMIRVFTVGESAAAINSSGSESPLARYLKLTLAASAEHINCGLGGYGSHEITPIVEELSGYSPDVVIILVGNNGDSFRQFQCGAERKITIRSYTLKERLLHPSYTERQVEGAVSLRLLEDDLRRMIRVARHGGAQVVVCTLPASLKDFAPRGVLPLKNIEFAKAWLTMDRKDFRRAATLFSDYLKRHDEEPFAWYCLGMCAEKNGA
jgi:hypothetical protein